MNIFIDLDGPILDNASRLYQLHADIILQFGFKPLSKYDYWQLKRDQVKEEMILKKIAGFDQKLIEVYQKQRSNWIESKKYLALNEVTPGCYNSLNFLLKQGNLILITTRKNQDNFNWELREKKLVSYFNKILSDFDDRLPAWKIKASLIRQYYPAFKKKNIIIGDTEAEILAGRNLGIFSIGLTNGIRSLKKIILLKPNLICQDLNELVKKWPQILRKVGF